MPSSDPPTVTHLNLADDDDLWLVETNLTTLVAFLTDPIGFVRSHVSIRGIPAVLSEPFVIVFQEMVNTKNEDQVFIQGIDHTAVINVRHVAGAQTGKSMVSPLPADEPHDILRHGSHVYSHLQLTGMDKEAVAKMIVRAISSQEDHFTELNGLQQRIKGHSTDVKLTFKPRKEHPTQFIYESWDASGHPVMSRMKDCDPPPPPPPACGASSGDADEYGNVYVNGVLIKTYNC